MKITKTKAKTESFVSTDDKGKHLCHIKLQDHKNVGRRVFTVSPNMLTWWKFSENFPVFLMMLKMNQTILN